MVRSGQGAWCRGQKSCHSPECRQGGSNNLPIPSAFSHAREKERLFYFSQMVFTVFHFLEDIKLEVDVSTRVGAQSGQDSRSA